MSKIKSILAFVAVLLCGGAFAATPVVSWNAGEIATGNKDGFAVSIGDSDSSVVTIEDGVATISNQKTTASLGLQIAFPSSFTTTRAAILVEYAEYDLSTANGNNCLISANWGSQSTAHETMVHGDGSGKHFSIAENVLAGNNGGGTLHGTTVSIPTSGYMLMTMSGSGDWQGTRVAYAKKLSTAPASSFIEAIYAPNVRETNGKFTGVKIGGTIASVGKYHRPGMKIKSIKIFDTAVTASDLNADMKATVSADYQRFYENFADRVMSISSTANDVNVGSSAAQATVTIYDMLSGANSSTSYNCAGTGYTSFPGNYTASSGDGWKMFCSSQTGYSAPGLVWRFPTYDAEHTTSINVNACFGPLSLGGLIVEENAASLTESPRFQWDGTNRETALGDSRTSGAVPTFFILKDTLILDRGSTTTIYGDITFDIAQGKMLKFGSGSISLSNNAVLRLKGSGVINYSSRSNDSSAIDASGKTLDFSGKTSANTAAYFEGPLTVSAATKFFFPAGFGEGDTFKLCTGTLSAPETAENVAIKVGDVSMVANLTYNTSDKTVSYTKVREASAIYWSKEANFEWGASEAGTFSCIDAEGQKTSTSCIEGDTIVIAPTKAGVTAAQGKCYMGPGFTGRQVRVDEDVAFCLYDSTYNIPANTDVEIAANKSLSIWVGGTWASESIIKDGVKIHGDGTLTISGTTRIDGAVTIDCAISNPSNTIKLNTDGSLKVPDGTNVGTITANDTSKYHVLRIKENGYTTYTLSYADPVAAIEGTEYPRISSAIDAANDNQAVELLVETSNETIKLSNNARIEVPNGVSRTLSGAISGAYSLTKLGAGTLTLSGGNSYAAGTDVAGGTLIMGHNAALGGGSKSAIVRTGATLNLGENNSNLLVLTLDGGTLTTSATIGYNSTMMKSISLTKDSVINIPAGKRHGIVNSSWNATTLDLGGCKLTKTGDGEFALGQVTFTDGTLRIEGGSIHPYKGANNPTTPTYPDNASGDYSSVKLELYDSGTKIVGNYSLTYKEIDLAEFTGNAAPFNKLTDSASTVYHFPSALTEGAAFTLATTSLTATDRTGTAYIGTELEVVNLDFDTDNKTVSYTLVNAASFNGKNYSTVAKAIAAASDVASAQNEQTVTLNANCSENINIPQHVIVDTSNFSVTGKISGSGVLMIDKQSGSSRGTVSGNRSSGAVDWNLSGLDDAETWTGTIWLKNAYWTSFHFATLGNAKSTVRLTNVGGYSYDSNNASAGFTGTLELVDDGSTAALTIDNAWNSTYFVSTLKGSGTFATSGTQTSAARYAFVDASAFTGSFNLNGNNKSVTIGDDLDVVNDYCTGNNILIQASGSATIDSRKTWSATTVTVNGTIKGSGTLGSATTFGDGATINLKDGALTASGTVTFGNTLNVTGATLDVGMVVLNVSNFTGALPSIVGSDLELEFSNGAIRVAPASVTEMSASALNTAQLMRIRGNATLNVDADITGTPAIVNASGSAVTLTLKAVAPKVYVSAADVKKLQLGTNVTLAYDWKPGKIISMNLNSGSTTDTLFYMAGDTVDGTLGGSVPRSSWNNLAGGAGTKSVTLGYNSEGVGSTFPVYGMSLVITASGTHNSNIGGQVVAPFMHGYIDDRWDNLTANTYTLSGIPFAKYDVIVYFQGDTDNDTARFGAVKINDTTKYGFDANGEIVTTVADDYTWGKSRQAKFAYGVNVIRITEQTGSSIKIVPLRPTSTQRSTVAAIQIVRTSTDQEEAEASEATVTTGDTTVTHLTLASALVAAESGSTVTLLKTVAGGNAVLKDGVTLEIGNYTVTGALDIKTGALIKKNGTPKIDGFATSFDVTYTNVNAFAYRYKDTGWCRSDNNNDPGYNNTKGDKSTGAMLKNHPWIQDIEEAFFTSTKQLTLATAGVMPQANNTIFTHMGSSKADTSYGLYLATGASDDEVIVGYNKGSGTNLITKITVPNARSTRHTYVITKDDVTEGDSKTTFVIYLDGLKWKTFVRKPRFEITGGFQSGSDFGGNVVQAGNLASVASTDSKSYVNFLRVYNRIISEAEIAQYSVDGEYPYTSPNGTYTREIAADGNWVATDQWSYGSSNVEKPSAKGNVKLTATHAEGDAASTKTVTVNLNEEVQYEKLTLSGDPMIFEGATASKPIKSVATVIGTTVTLKEGAIDLTAGPTIILDGGKLLLDYSSLTEAAVAEHPIDAKVTDEIEEDENLGTDDAKIAVLTPSEMGRMFVELRYIDSCYHVVAALKPVYLKSDNTLALEDGTAVTSLYDNEQIVVSSVGYVGNARWGVNLNNDKLIGHPIYIDYSNNGNDPGVSVSSMLSNHAIEIAEGSVMYVAENINIQNATITGDGTFKLTRPINVNGTLSIASAFSAVETGKFVLKTAAATVTVPAAIDSSRVECGVDAMSVKVTTNNDNTVTYSLIGRLATIAGVDCFTKDDILAHPAGTIANIGNGLSVNGDGHLELNGEDLMIAVNEGVISPIVEAAEEHNLIISEICPKTSAWDENHKDAGWLELHNTGSKWVNFGAYTLGRYNRGKAVKATEWTNGVTLSIAPGARLVVKTSEDYSAKSKKTIVQYGNDLHNAIVFDSKVNPKKYPLVVLIKGGKVVQNCVVPVDVPENMSVCYDGELKNGAIASYITTASKGEASNFEGAVAVGPQISPLYAVKDAVDPWQKFSKATIGEAYPITVPVNPIMDGNAKNEIASVKLIYRIDFGAEFVVETPMTKSETKDAKKGYTYTGEIPGSAITTAGQLVRWAVQITDVGGNEWRSPSFNYGDDGYEYFGTIVTPSEEQLSGGLNTWHLFADPDEVADGIGTENKKGESCLMNRDADASNFKTTRHPNGGRVGIYDMETGLYYDNVRIDKRGRTTGAFTKKAHGLKFSKSQPFTGTDSLTGEKIECRKSSITAEYGDPTFIRQELAFEVMRRNGVKAPFHYPVRLNLNGQFYQLAFHSERFSDELIEDFYGLDGKGYAYKNVGTFHNGTNNSSERKTPDDGSRDLTTNDPVLRAFCDTLNGVNNIGENTDFAANPTYSADVSKVVTQSFDLPAWINYMAATKITAETDDTWANLSAYYDINGTGTWMPLAYDMNQSLGQWHFADDRARGRIGLVADKDDFKSHPFYGGLHIRMHNNAGNASGNPNYAYEAIFQSEKFRRLFLRRLRTIMDKEIGVTVYADQASEKSALFTSAAQMVATINELGLKDRSIWTDYANVDFANNTDRSTNGSCDKIWVWPQSMTEQLGTPQGGLKDLWDNYIAPRRAYLYGKHLASNGSVAVGYGLNLSAGIPAAQSDIATLKGTDENPKITARYDATLGTVIIENDNEETIDLSGWKLTGPVTMTIPEGTVLDQKVGEVKGQVYLTANRKATIVAFGANLADQVIVGNGAANGAETPISLRTPEGVRVVGEPTAQELYIRFDAFYGATLGDVLADEWFSIKNIGEEAVEYTGMTVCIIKDGDGEEKDHCHVTLPEGTLEAGASKKFVPSDFATGFVKIQNNTVNISVYDLYMSPIQKMQVTQKDYTWAYLHGAYLEHQTDSGKWHQVWDASVQGDLVLADYADGTKTKKALAKDLYVRASAPMKITLENPSFDASSTLKISGAGTVTITGTLNAKVNTTAIKSTGNLIFADGSYTITAGDDCIQADGDITINGGTFICHSTGNDGIDANGDIIINGGTIFAFTAANEAEEGADPQYSTGLDVNTGHTITINGGTVIATSAEAAALNALDVKGSQAAKVVAVTGLAADEAKTLAIADILVPFPAMTTVPTAVLVSKPGMTEETNVEAEEVSDGIELVAADGDAPAKSVVVPASWAADKTDEQKVAAAEAFVLGLAEPTEKPMVSSEQTTEANSIRIVDNVAPRFGTGVTVKRTLFVGTTPEASEESPVKESDNGFTVSLPTEGSKVKYIKIKYSFK